ncbi:MAG: trypsin-like serine protease [Verrucomicrobiales bacterium]|nr:trypsin-like serine protease [Verrucomicrobiales bacterium]
MNPRHLTAAMAVVAIYLPIQSAIGTSLIPGISGRIRPSTSGSLDGQATVEQLIQAGHPDPASEGFPAITPDSPSNRVDPNTTTSPFAGVGSIFIDPDPDVPGGFICTGTPISPWEVVTAGHCLDVVDGDGKPDVAPQNVQFVLNYGSDLSHIIPAVNLFSHPDYTGFGNPSINDDVAVIRLSQPLPAGVPIYKMVDPNWLGVAPIVLAGYGTSGDGANGYYVNPSFRVKRTGANLVEYAETDDEGGAQVELVAWDFEFEGDPFRYDYFGIPFSFPNDVESTLGGGDSGGPGFMFNPFDPTDNSLYLATVNTFSFWDTSAGPDHDEPGKFGAGSGGMWLGAEYQQWITSVPETSTWFAGLTLGGLALASMRKLRRRG